MDLVTRAKNILLKPKEEWPVIAGETTNTADLYKNYVAPLAAVPAVAGLIGMSLVGMPMVGRIGIGAGLVTMVVQYVLALAAVYVLALVIDALAPNFGAEKNMGQALKVAAYSMTAAWLAGIFAIIPMLGILSILGLYSFYLLYLGLPVLMKAPAEKATLYTVVVVIVAIVIWLIIGAATGILMPRPEFQIQGR
ncbi:MAG TPA: Yip1 family protein [Burkholderiales bacterium]